MPKAKPEHGGGWCVVLPNFSRLSPRWYLVATISRARVTDFGYGGLQAHFLLITNIVQAKIICFTTSILVCGT